MTRRTVYGPWRALAVSLPAFAACAVLSCSSSLGDVPVDLPAEGVSAPVPCTPPDNLTFVERCPSRPYTGATTALEVLDAFEEAAEAALGVDGAWSGTISGVGIGRDGRNAETGLSGWTSFWTSGERSDPDMLVIDATSGICKVQNRCTCVSLKTCPGYSPADGQPVKPGVDSPAAIAEAFPDDPENTTYDLSFDQTTARWTVVRHAVQ